MEITTYESQEGTSVANKTQILYIGLGEEDKCSKLPLDKNTYDATVKENEDASQMNTKKLTENINQGLIIANQTEGHKKINTIQAGTKDQLMQLRNDNQNEGEKRINWKRRARLVGASNSLNKDTKLKSVDENCGELVIIEEGIQATGDK
ncbi:hypothetical protein KY289_035617 [Solanum tuberosum]|nr:hypothetical protein KY289_035617 [Solanum tuberosum]